MRRLLVAAMALCAITLAAAPKTAHDNMPAAHSETAPSSSVATETAEAPPSELRIGDLQFEVQLQPFPDTYVGMTHFETRTVQIDPASQGEMRKQVFLHELMHVAWHNGKPSADKNRKFTEEEAIRELTPGLLKMLAENPDAVKYLQK